MAEDRIVVAGGGLGGLGVALGLAQNGKRAVVLEKAPELGEIGAGIQLGPNAFHAFDYLGVGKGAREQAVYVEQLRFMDAMTSEEINPSRWTRRFVNGSAIPTPWCTGRIFTRNWSRPARNTICGTAR